MGSPGRSCTLHIGIPQGDKPMNVRDTILQNVRNNQPTPRELSAVSAFRSPQSLDVKEQFVAALKQRSGEVVAEPPAHIDPFLRKRFPDAKRSVRRFPNMPATESQKTFLVGPTPAVSTLRSWDFRPAWLRPPQYCFPKTNPPPMPPSFSPTPSLPF